MTSLYPLIKMFLTLIRESLLAIYADQQDNPQLAMVEITEGKKFIPEWNCFKLDPPKASLLKRGKEL